MSGGIAIHVDAVTSRPSLSVRDFLMFWTYFLHRSQHIKGALLWREQSHQDGQRVTGNDSTGCDFDEEHERLALVGTVGLHAWSMVARAGPLVV